VIHGTARGTADSAPLLKKISEIAEQAADEFSLNEIPEWQWNFCLARRLQAVTGVLDLDLNALRPAVERFWQEDMANFRWIDFVSAWHRVRNPEGEGTLERAHRRAIDDPVKLDLPVSLGSDFDLLVSLVYHLGAIRGERFFLPQERLAKLLDTDRRYISKLLVVAVKYNVLVKTKGHNHAKREACEYRLGSAFADRKVKVKTANLDERRATLKAQAEELKRRNDGKA
jgi:hypothetical protein